MTSSSFPYGNDLNYPSRWVSNYSTKSLPWIVGYHSGLSIGLGAHTFLFFGGENLTAMIVRFVGAGPSEGLGVGKMMKTLSRNFGRSQSSVAHGKNTEALDAIEHGEDALGVLKAAESDGKLAELNSAKAIYDKLYKDGGAQLAPVMPFAPSELDYRTGILAGIDLEYLFGASSYYLISADNLFHDQQAPNISVESSFVSAGINTMVGIWRVEKTFSLWEDLHNSRVEYPFRAYDVHRYFWEYKLEGFISGKLSENEEIIQGIRGDMIENPEKYGLPKYSDDPLAAHNKILKLDRALIEAGGDPSRNPYMPWIPMKEQHRFFTFRKNF